MIDLGKLTSAPWRSERRFSNGCEVCPRIHCTPSKDREYGWIADVIGAPYLGYESTLANAEFIALARNAFAALQEYGVSTERIFDGPWTGAWKVTVPDGITDCEEWKAWCEHSQNRFPTSFDALAAFYLWKRARLLREEFPEPDELTEREIVMEIAIGECLSTLRATFANLPQGVFVGPALMSVIVKLEEAVKKP